MGELLTGQSLPITAYELQFWQQFSVIEPFGFPQKDYHAALGAAAAANQHSKPVAMSDLYYRPPVPEEEEEEEIDEGLAEELAWGRVLGGKKG